METIKMTCKLTADEKETLLNYDSVVKNWTMDSTVPKHFKKALHQGWTPIKQYVNEDGAVCGMVLVAPERSITIRNTNKKQMSAKQLGNLTSYNE